ncbi:MAG TPA: succinylglutamate desuccinylase/aspartoacylase family protein [Terrimicrobiaceae bacterium]
MPFPVSTSHRPSVKQRRSLRPLLRPLEELARGSDYLFAAHLGYGDSLGISQSLARYLFAGPGEKRSYLRVGVFAGVHGDEESGVQATIALLERLHADPERARGYELFVYPVCNPWAYRERSRWTRSGEDLNRQFWKDSPEVEVQVLERQLRNLNFNGIISLHSDDTSEGVYGFVKGHELTRHVLEPALEAAGHILPRNFDKSIDNFEANDGIIEQGYDGILSAPPEQKPRPFEVVFETPHHAAFDKQVEAHIVAVQTILDRFKVMISEAQDI